MGGVIAIVGLTAGDTTAETSLRGTAAIRIPPGESSGAVELYLVADANGMLVLTAGDLIDRSTKEVLPGTVTFEPATLSVEAGQQYKIRAVASKILFEGDADVDVMSRGAKIGSIVVARSPFAVTLPETAAVFRPGAKTAIALRNDSRHALTLRWMLQIGPVKYCGPPTAARKSCDAVTQWSVVSIPPKDAQSIEVEPPLEWFPTTRWVSAWREDATLWLALTDDLPKRQLRMASLLQGSGYPGQTAWIVILLALGALLSLVVRHWVPNMQRKRELKEQIRRVKAKVGCFSEDIAEDLREQTRVQVTLIDSRRKSVWTIVPDYATIAAQSAQALAILEKRVDLIEATDSAYQAVRVKWESCPPPSLLDRIEEALRGVQDVLRNPAVSEEGLASVRDEIDKARGLINLMGTADAAFGKELAARASRVRAEIEKFKSSAVLADLKQKVRGLFAVVGLGGADAGGNEPGPLPTDGDGIDPIRYGLVDYDLSGLEICRDYVWLADGATADVEERLKADLGPTLLRHLQRRSWNELWLERLLLKQFREASTGTDIWDAIEQGNKAMFISLEPAEVCYQQLVQFRARFRRPELDWSGAKTLVVPEWQFPDGTKKRGWTISHFFVDRRTRWQKIRHWRSSWLHERKPIDTPAITVSFERVVNGAPAVPVPGQAEAAHTTAMEVKQNALRVDVPLWSDPSDDGKSRTVNELIALVVSVAVPLVSLVAGAREQLAANPAAGAMTVFLLGFSSEALISVFRQRVTTT